MDTAGGSELMCSFDDPVSCVLDGKMKGDVRKVGEPER
jgi:hypothetical protein